MIFIKILLFTLLMPVITLFPKEDQFNEIKLFKIDYDIKRMEKERKQQLQRRIAAQEKLKRKRNKPVKPKKIHGANKTRKRIKRRNKKEREQRLKLHKELIEALYKQENRHQSKDTHEQDFQNKIKEEQDEFFTHKLNEHKDYNYFLHEQEESKGYKPFGNRIE